MPWNSATARRAQPDGAAACSVQSSSTTAALARAPPPRSRRHPSSCSPLTGGSTATTIRPTPRRRSHRPPNHLARPERVGHVLDQFAIEFLPSEHRAAIAARDRLHERLRQVRCVAPPAPRPRKRIATSRLTSRVAGASSCSCRGRSPSRSPNCSMSHAASPFCHLPISSHHAAANCGPRKRSGSSERKTPSPPRRSAIPAAAATAAIPAARRAACGATGPDGPSIITSRASCAVSPMSAMLRARWSA